MTQPGKRTASVNARDRDHFAMFEMERSFDLDVEELERRYLALSREVHPDRFVTAGAGERVAALQQSMQLNDAYKTLVKPIARAEYLLACEGMTIGGHDPLDQLFLMEVMTHREELQQAIQANDRSRLRELEEKMLDRRESALEKVGASFGQLESERGRGEGKSDRAEKLLQEIKNELIRLRYIERYIEEFDDLEEEGEL